ncbi:hypothetical protein Tco_1285435 [Tanacetum coccineum]
MLKYLHCLLKSSFNHDPLVAIVVSVSVVDRSIGTDNPLPELWFHVDHVTQVLSIMDTPPSQNHVNDLPADEPRSPDNIFGFPVGEPHDFDDSDLEFEEDPQEEVKEDPQEEPKEEPKEDPKEDPEEKEPE